MTLRIYLSYSSLTHIRECQTGSGSQHTTVHRQASVRCKPLHRSDHHCFQLPASNCNDAHGTVLLHCRMLDVAASNCNDVYSKVLLNCRMLDVVASDADLFGAERAQQARQQQGWLTELKAGLLSGNLFRHFLQQHCSRGSQTSQICGHQAFAQAVSASIRFDHVCEVLDCWCVVPVIACDLQLWFARASERSSATKAAFRATSCKPALSVQQLHSFKRDTASS